MGSSDATTASRRPRVAILLSTLCFEDFYGGQLGLSHDEYVRGYRNDWSWEWCAMLAQRGLETSIYVASLERDGAHPTPDGHRVRFLRLGRAYAPWRCLPVLKRSPLGRYAAGLANSAAMHGALIRGLRDDRIDVLCIQEYWTARFDHLVDRVPVPVVAVDQGMRDRYELKLFKRATLPRAADVFTQTEAESRKVARYGGRPTHIVNGVDTAFFTPAVGGADPSPGAPRVVLNVARLDDAQKRQSTLIRAVARLPRHWRLELVGTGPDRHRLEALALECGVADRVDFRGLLLDREELRERYRACAVFALPSAWEGLPMALLEAMSCGAAIVGSDIPAIAEVARHDVEAMLVPGASPERLGHAIEQAHRDRARLGAAARRTAVERYSKVEVERRLVRALTAAAGNGSPARREPRV